MRIPLTMVSGLLLLVLTCSWNEPSRLEAASQQQSEKANTEAQQREREEYSKSIQAKLDEYDKKLDGLDAQVSTMNGTEKDDFKKMIQQLRDQKKGIAAQLDSAKNASPGAWGVMKADVDSGLKKLERSYQDVSKKYELTPVTPSKDQKKQ
jgi:septal ring factor EnvC (AmiA/AmiB activator)